MQRIHVVDGYDEYTWVKFGPRLLDGQDCCCMAV